MVLFCFSDSSNLFIKTNLKGINDPEKELLSIKQKVKDKTRQIPMFLTWDKRIKFIGPKYHSISIDTQSVALLVKRAVVKRETKAKNFIKLRIYTEVVKLIII